MKSRHAASSLLDAILTITHSNQFAMEKIEMVLATQKKPASKVTTKNSDINYNFFIKAGQL